jgi:hypothetical protein
MENVRLRMENHDLKCAGAFSIERDPFSLVPLIDAYAEKGEDGEPLMSGGFLRDGIRRWLAGANFRDPAQRTWEQK